MLKRHYIFLLGILIFSLWGVKAYFHDGLWTAHDIWHQVARLYWYSQALRDGQFFPGYIMSMANGYGYPLFIFSYHLPWMIGAPLVNAGLSTDFVMKLLFVVSYFGSGLLMYGFLYDWWKDRLAACVGSVSYLWVPYHFLTLFVTAAIGTAFAFTFLPLIFWGIFRIVRDGGSRSGIALVSIGTSAVILCHLMTLVMILPVIVTWVLVLLIPKFMIAKKVKVQTFLSFVITGILTIGLVSFYSIPMVNFLPLIRANDSGEGFSGLYSNFFPSFKQLIYSKWGYGPIISNAKDGEISLQIGIIQWLGIAGLIVLGFLPNIRKKYGSRILQIIIMFTITIFLLIDFSKPLWDLINVYITLDYPFRLLLPAAFVGSMATGACFTLIKFKWLKVVGLIGCMVVMVYTNRNHTRVNEYTYFPLDLYIASEKTTNTFNEYLPKTAANELINEKYERIIPETISIRDIQRKTNMISFTTTVQESTTFTVNQFDFPTLQLVVDLKIQPKEIDNQGRLLVTIPEGSHRVLLRSVNTPIMNVALGLSCISLLFLGGLFLWPIKKQVKK